MSWLGDYVKTQIITQKADIRSVKITIKWSDRFKKFYIDSSAGLLIYKPKNQEDQTRFRDKWINKADLLKQREDKGEFVRKDLFKLYAEIRKSERVSYEANVNTRLKSLCSLIL